jgi:anti-anti-sigma regulatory factor
MNSSQPLPSRAAQLLAQVTLASLRRAERLVARKARALDEATQHHSRLIVNVVDDPRGTMQLIGVRGPLTPETVGTLAEALFAVRDGLSLHLDVSDASISGPAVVEQVEQLVDQLELRRVRIRIVGLDPRHPALSYHRPR